MHAVIKHAFAACCGQKKADERTGGHCQGNQAMRQSRASVDEKIGAHKQPAAQRPYLPGFHMASDASKR